MAWRRRRVFLTLSAGFITVCLAVMVAGVTMIATVIISWVLETAGVTSPWMDILSWIALGIIFFLSARFALRLGRELWEEDVMTHY